MATLFEDGVEIVKAFDRVEAKIFIVKQTTEPNLNQVKASFVRKPFWLYSFVSSNVFDKAAKLYDQGSGWRGTWEFDGAQSWIRRATILT